MKVQSQGHRNRRKRILSVWVEIAKDYSAGLPIESIRERNPNPATGEPYARQHIHYILRQLRNKPISELFN